MNKEVATKEDEGKSLYFSFRFGSVWMRDAFEKLSEAHYRTIAGELNAAISEHLARHGMSEKGVRANGEAN